MTQQRDPLVMIADDNPDFSKAVAFHLQSWGYRVEVCQHKQALLAALAIQTPAVLFLDLRFGADDGIEVLGEVVSRYPGLAVVLLTGHGSIETAVDAMKAGAYDFLTKPPDLERLRLITRHAVERQAMADRIATLDELVDKANSAGRLLGDSPALERIRKLIDTVARADATVLILGESGSGKELVARALHEKSGRAGAFVPMNMAALPAELVESVLFGHERGAFTGADRERVGACEEADGGTLFLDEIGEMPVLLQAKLLRFLQERIVYRIGSSRPRPVKIRIVAATHRDLAARIADGLFRDDLYYRLNEVPIQLPPLRERRGDIPLLALHFLKAWSARYGKPDLALDPEALATLTQHHWPGNVRELENLLHRVVLLAEGPRITRGMLPDEYLDSARHPLAPKAVIQRPSVPAPELTPDFARSDLDLHEIEGQTIREALIASKGQVGEAAFRLGVSPATLYRKLKRYGLAVQDYR